MLIWNGLCVILLYIKCKIMNSRTFAQEAIYKRIGEKQKPLRFQDFGYGDEHTDAPYNDYGDYFDNSPYFEVAD